MMLLSPLFAAAAMASVGAPQSFLIVGVSRDSAFAGRLGQRVSREVLVLRSGSQTIQVRIDGAYHTNFMPKGQVFAVGQNVALRWPLKGVHAPRANVVIQH